MASKVAKKTKNMDVTDTIKETGKSTDDRLDMVISLINDIKVENKEIFQKLEKRLDKFEKSMEFINKQFENHKAITESLIKRNTKLEECNANLTKQVDDLNGQIQSLRQDHNDLEQYGRREAIEIGGIPREKDEDTVYLVLKVGKALGISVDEPDIEACHRISSREDAAIICRFASRKMKVNFMSNRKKQTDAPFKRKDLGFISNKDRKVKVFINESLTPRNKLLLKKARDRKKELGWKYVWTRNGTNYARKEKDIDFVRIKEEQDIFSKMF
ncbi:uncharacterized protein LOC135688975 [Rhopilema esculentum]|uniref:uncharacterized protein LOC135688975 n=1 Tax=Rhopilema esculentum TaxID=499914 RepID=UPI0031DC33EC|eukprot:gene7644-13463_t